ncbi:hypothetical protein [Streptomyces sp. RFCAC02]|uniref:hypothetical protein n=1 Tax=Streptomyces sp. RFCAC02 TaxID=2499143 RepID=UPI001020550B|nr:hypothetical protein [Streptomyces sp. RFCAC02]
MDPNRFDGYVRTGPTGHLPLRDAARQLDAVVRYAAAARALQARLEEHGDVPAADPERALDFAHDAPYVRLADDDGEVVAVVVSPAVIEVLADALGLTAAALARATGTDTPVTTDALRTRLPLPR